MSDIDITVRLRERADYNLDQCSCDKCLEGPCVNCQDAAVETEAADEIVRLRSELAGRDAEIAAWLRGQADGAKAIWAEEETKPNMGDVFWRRYWAGYHTGVDATATAIASGQYKVEVNAVT